MIMRIKAFLGYNLKSLLQDKLSYIWGAVLPILMMILYSEYISQPLDLSFYWIYILVINYINGIGLTALRLREYGYLKTIFSITDDKVSFFLSSLLLQLISCSLWLAIFNIVASILFDFNFLYLFIKSMQLSFLCIPIGFLSYNLTLLRNVNVATVNSLLNIIVFLLFILSNIGSDVVNTLSPLIFLPKLLTPQSFRVKFLYTIFFIVSIIISLPSIKNFQPISGERR